MYGIPPPPPPPPPAEPSPAATPAQAPRKRTPPSSSRISELADDPPASKSTEPSLVAHLLDDPLALLTDHKRCFDLVAGLLLVWECVLCVAVVHYVRYTEIDFSTYLQQAQAFLSGARDYSLMKGDSGYPALHIYAYAGLSWLTDGGKALQRAQWAFAGVYVATLAVVMFGIYRRNERIPPYALILLTLSKRLHSVYMLRMFNDALVMLLVYSAIALYMVPARGNSRSERKRVERRWMLGTVLLSCALSIKMSTLLFLPALFYLLFVHFSLLHLLQHLALLLLPLALLSTPFLSTPSHARTYASQAFHFTREFDFRYTLNWRFLGEEAFSRPGWGVLLLAAHAGGLALWALKWAEEDGGVALLLRRAARFPGRKPSPAALSPSRIATVFFLANLTGVLCARSLHPQFYAWFAWSLPWLVSGGAGMGAVEGWTGIALLLAIEYGMSVWPSTDNSSLGLVLAMLVLLVRSYYAEAEPARVGGAGKEDAWVVPPRWEEQGEGEGKEE
ncbi:dolichyl-P-Man:Man(5)GlcNAc(2)-PP-dolichol alpha-1,3-mannosyltransferase [Rhodotorula kratochvilovae]